MVEEQKNQKKQEEKPLEAPLETPSKDQTREPATSQPAADKQAGRKPKPEPRVADKADEKIKVPAKFKKLVDEIEKMSIMDLAELVKILEKKFGVSPMVAAPVAAGAPTDSGGEGEEKTEFAIELKVAGDQKINVIKIVREVIGKGLKEAKDLVDSAPQVLKENVKKEEAEEIKDKLEKAGATVELK